MGNSKDILNAASTPLEKHLHGVAERAKPPVHEYLETNHRISVVAMEGVGFLDVLEATVVQIHFFVLPYAVPDRLWLYRAYHGHVGDHGRVAVLHVLMGALYVDMAIRDNDNVGLRNIHDSNKALIVSNHLP